MIGVIIQARTGSKRFPRKIYQNINGKSTLFRVLSGVKKASVPHKIILAMPEYDRVEFEDKLSNNVFEGAIDHRFSAYFGDPDNLVDRYFNAARTEGIDLIVRVTADCPLIQGDIIDEMLIEYLKHGYNGFMGNNQLISSNPFPDGIDVEIFPFWLLAETRQLTNDPVDLEHVCPFMYRKGTQYIIYPFYNQRPNRQINTALKDFSFDTDEDYELLEKLTKKYDTNGEDLNKAIESVYKDLNNVSKK